MVLFFALFAYSLSALSIAIPYIAIAALLGWLLADLLSGLVHWALDSFGSVRTPVLGPAFIRPFREHHADPEAMARHDFIEVNGASCLGSLPLLLLSCFLDGFFHAIVLATCMGVLLTNQCHKWSHAAPDEVSPLVRTLQESGLVLRPSAHRLHHKPPYDSHFCTASGWLNRPLDALLRALR